MSLVQTLVYKSETVPEISVGASAGANGTARNRSTPTPIGAVGGDRGIVCLGQMPR